MWSGSIARRLRAEGMGIRGLLTVLFIGLGFIMALGAAADGRRHVAVLVLFCEGQME